MNLNKTIILSSNLSNSSSVHSLLPALNFESTNLATKYIKIIQAVARFFQFGIPVPDISMYSGVQTPNPHPGNY